MIKLNKNEKKEKEDATKYGEFISTYFAWNTLEEQKKVAEKLENITKQDKS